MPCCPGWSPPGWPWRRRTASPPWSRCRQACPAWSSSLGLSAGCLLAGAPLGGLLGGRLHRLRLLGLLGCRVLVTVCEVLFGVLVTCGVGRGDLGGLLVLTLVRVLGLVGDRTVG